MKKMSITRINRPINYPRYQNTQSDSTVSQARCQVTQDNNETERNSIVDHTPKGEKKYTHS